MASVTFYSSIRRGAALAIERADFSPAPGGEAGKRAQLAVTLNFAPDRAAHTSLTLVGPGDIVGLDSRCIVRTFPGPDDNDAEGGFLAYVEFDQIDLPWRYTPAKLAGSVADRSDRVRPWLSLLVLEEGSELGPSDLQPPKSTGKLPLLALGNPALLPDLSEAWAFAHVQGKGALDEAGVEQTLAGRPGPLVARLLSPRKLRRQTAYRAFLVPTFLRGVLAGRGQDPGETDALAPAWDADGAAAVTLPVYYSWRFQTGNVSSFEEVARQLRPSAELPASVGVRALDVRSPGFGLPAPVLADTLSLGGALTAVHAVEPPEPALRDSWVNGLGAFIDQGTRDLGGTTIRVVTPPLYGRWYAAEAQLDRRPAAPASNPPWFFELNADPRYRVAAALGTEVVQRDQQALMAAAWEQAARLEQANRARRLLQAGREVFTRLLTRHINLGPTYAIFSAFGPMFGRIVSCGPGAGPTIAGTLDDGPIRGRLAPPWRRHFPGDPTILIDEINRGGFEPDPDQPGGMNTPGGTIDGEVPGGLPDPDLPILTGSMSADERLFWGVVVFWVARKLLASEAGRYFWLLRKLLRFGLDLIQLASAQGATNVAFVQKLRSGTALGGDLKALPQAFGFTPFTRDPDLFDTRTWPVPRIPASSGALDEADAFRDAAAQLLDYVNGAPAAGPVLKKANIGGLLACVLGAVKPADTFVAVERSRHVFTRTIRWQAPDQLEPILLAPEVPHPMWQALRDISPDWILPNLGDVPRNTVSLVRTDQKFIESFMTGLNHEMTRELLWNGYPTDQRGTYFQQFWDFRGWVDDGQGGSRPEQAFADIQPIASWPRASPLGQNRPTAGVRALVLLVRGDLIKRYPNVVVYATKSGSTGLDDAQHRYPAFQGVLAGDVAYYGFEVAPQQFDELTIRGDGSPGSGWFFVLQEHPSEPKFKQGTLLNPPSTADVNVHPGAFPDPTSGAPNAAADVALNAYERPLRVAFQGKDLLPLPA